MHLKRILATAFQCSNCNMFLAATRKGISTTIASASSAAALNILPKTTSSTRMKILQARGGGSGRCTNTNNHSNAFFSSTTTTALASAPSSSSLADIAAEEARQDAKKFGYNDFESWLTTGGDDRSLILEHSGANKYHIKPRAIEEGHIFRGSCTGNPPTTRGYEAAKKLYEERLEKVLETGNNQELDLVLRDIYATQRYRIATMLNLPRGAEVILCPSGSDAEYIPVGMAKTLKGNDSNDDNDDESGGDHENNFIKNGVTQLNEIGAGTAPAAVGEYFSTHAPFIGKLKDGVKKLDGFDGIEGCIVPARTADGSVVDAATKMKEFAEDCIAKGQYPIVHGVFGGKTGVRDTVMPPSLDEGRTSMGIVDACQGRFSLEEMKEWMEQDSVVLFTTSKFYQAPPFCGAVIVPPSIAEQLFQSTTPPVDMLTDNGLGAYLTDKELPNCLKSWKPFLNDDAKNNVGLALRWEAGLAAMEKLSSVSDEKRTEVVDEWAGIVTEMVSNESPQLDPWCIERSIISIRMSNNNGGHLNMKEARDLYRWMSMDVSSAVPEASEDEKVALSTVAYIGQPVSVSESHAIVRIALGVESMLSYIEDKNATLKEDQMTVKKLAAISKYFATLSESDF